MEPSRGNQEPHQSPSPSPPPPPQAPQPQVLTPGLTPGLTPAQAQAQWEAAARRAGREALRAERSEAQRQWVERTASTFEWRPVLVFLVIAFALAWIVCLPLYMSEGLANPWFGLIAVCMMATPAIAALVVVGFVRRPPSIPRELGLWPLGRAPRFLSSIGLAVLMPVALILVALPIGALLGVYPADFVHFSAFQAVIDAQLAASGIASLPIPIGLLVLAQLLNVVIGAVINTVPALGEELGWRGYLLPKLLPLGNVRAIIISGVVWGLWHAPLILLGYNYPYAPGWAGVLMMCGMCIVVGGVFGWLRLRSASVWPAALAHGAFNAAAGFSLVFAQAGERIDTLNATILGWSGWIVPAAVVVWLVATGRFSAGPPVAVGASAAASAGPAAPPGPAAPAGTAAPAPAGPTV